MSYSEKKKQINIQNRRTFFLFIGKLSLFSIVGWKLFNIQILESEPEGILIDVKNLNTKRQTVIKIINE